MRQLQPHQCRNRDALISALGKYGAALDASDTGTGKSATFLAVCQALNARPAIVTRKPVIDAWRRECAIMGLDPVFVVNYEQAKSPRFPYAQVSTSTQVNGYGEAKKTQRFDWNITGRTLFCFDEVQGCRDPRTLNSKMLLSAASKHRVCMASATPFTNPTEAMAIGSTLRLFTPNRFWEWQIKHGVRKNYLGFMEFCGGQKSEKTKQQGLAIMEGIHRDIFPERGCRTRRQDIPNFPDELTTVIGVEPDDLNEVQRAYQDLIDIAREADWERAQARVSEDLREYVEPLAITKALRARQSAEIQKCSAICELAFIARSKGESVAIFVNSDRTVEALARMMNTRCILRGDGHGESAAERGDAVRAFQANEQDFIIVNAQAGGAGISLHDPITQKPRTSLISPPWSALVLKQILGRTLRLGGGYSTRHLIFTKGTIEERVMKRVETMTDNLETLTDGDLDITQ